MNKTLLVILTMCIAVVVSFSLLALGEGWQDEIADHALVLEKMNPLHEGTLFAEELVFFSEKQEQATVELMTDTIYSSVEDAAEAVREHMKAREKKFTVRIWTKNSMGSELMTQIVEQALKPTGNPTEGDYLAWQYSGWRGTLKKSATNNGYHNTITFEMNYYTTQEQEREMDVAVDQLLQQLNVGDKSDIEKITAVYDYICQNVNYDYENLENTGYILKHTAYAALVNKAAVCQGYALLLNRLLLELEVDNQLIGGFSEKGTHAWNIVNIDGLYYNLDATWDAGVKEYRYFLRCAENFEDHRRSLKYETFEFHRTYPMSATDYKPGADAVAEPVLQKGVCGDNAIWTLYVEGRLIIQGNGSINDYPYSDSQEHLAPWQFWESQITNLTVGEGITRIGNYNFCDMRSLTQVSLPSTLVEIGRSAFYEDTSLATITIPSNVTTIDDSVFRGCTSLTAIILPNSVLQMGGNCFSGCDSLKSVTLSTNLKEISVQTFYECAMLEEIVLPEGVESICEDAFKGCVKLVQLVIPASVKSVGSCAFSNCASLREVTFGGNPALDFGVFEGDWALKSIRFCDDAPQLHERTFEGVKVVCYYDGFKEGWTDIAGNNYGGTLTWINETCDHAQTINQEGKAPTCTETGLTEGRECAGCGVVLVKQEVIPAVGHTEVTDPFKASTCTETGLTEGRHCEVCGKVTVAQRITPIAEHSFGLWTVTKEATEEEEGVEERTCSGCDKKEQRPIAKLEPAPTEPKPTEPAPTEPKPTEPAPTEPKPTAPAPTEPAPTEPKPTESAPTEPAPTEPEQMETVPTESETSPEETEPEETKLPDPLPSGDGKKEGGGAVLWIAAAVFVVALVGALILKKKK